METASATQTQAVAIASVATLEAHAKTSARISAVVKASAQLAGACALLVLSVSIAQSKLAAVVMEIAPSQAHASAVQAGWASSAKLACNAQIQAAVVMVLAPMETVCAQRASAV